MSTGDDDDDDGSTTIGLSEQPDTNEIAATAIARVAARIFRR